MYATYICFSLWSQRSELRKESEEDKVKLLDMCSASEANKELIHHKVRVSDKQETFNFYLWDSWPIILLFVFGRQATSNTKKLLFYLSVEHVVILLKHRICGLKLHDIYTQCIMRSMTGFLTCTDLKEFISKLSTINKYLYTHDNQ